MCWRLFVPAVLKKPKTTPAVFASGFELGPPLSAFQRVGGPGSEFQTFAELHRAGGTKFRRMKIGSIKSLAFERWVIRSVRQEFIF
jgi:hypothetical protein